MLALITVTNVRGQDSTRLKRVEFVVGASLAYSLIDYVGFNLLKVAHNSSAGYIPPVWYRFFQGAVQAAITYCLYKEFGIKSAIAFTLMWWTWVDDWGFYGWGNLLNPPYPWVDRATAYIPDALYGASWTPVGLVRKNNKYIPSNTLVAQAVIGLSISIAILW
jgi:hypothetical protein